jgi:hypothetical protein
MIHGEAPSITVVEPEQADQLEHARQHRHLGEHGDAQDRDQQDAAAPELDAAEGIGGGQAQKQGESHHRGGDQEGVPDVEREGLILKHRNIVVRTPGRRQVAHHEKLRPDLERGDDRIIEGKHGGQDDHHDQRVEGGQIHDLAIAHVRSPPPA